MVNTTPEILKELWQKGFFRSKRTFREIQSAICDKEYNPNEKTLYSAITRAKYLRRIGSKGQFTFIQLYKCDTDQNCDGMNKRINANILMERGIHPKILQVCEKLFEDGHFSQAIFEAYKAVNNMVKEKSGLVTLDGKDLMAKVFTPNAPKLRWSKLITQSERNEQEGFMYLFMGAIVGIRNPKAHDHIIQNDKQKTLDYLSFASMLAKLVDESEKTNLS